MSKDEALAAFIAATRELHKAEQALKAVQAKYQEALAGMHQVALNEKPST